MKVGSLARLVRWWLDDLSVAMLAKATVPAYVASRL